MSTYDEKQSSEERNLNNSNGCADQSTAGNVFKLAKRDLYLENRNKQTHSSIASPSQMRGLCNMMSIDS